MHNITYFYNSRTPFLIKVDVDLLCFPSPFKKIYNF